MTLQGSVIAFRLKQYMAKDNETPESVALKMGVELDQVNYWISGDAKPSDVVEICHFFRLSVSDVLF